MNRRQRAYVRRAVLEYARAYLGVKRLPAGVPQYLCDWVATLDEPPPGEAVASLVHRFRKPYWGL